MLGLLGLSGYFLNLSFASADPVTEDLYEDNDMFSTAKVLTDGQYSGLCLNDSDWFKVDVYAWQILEISISFHSSYTNMEISFYDDTGSFISTTNDIGLDQELLRYRMGLSHKFVYLEIWEYDGIYSAESYNLTVKRYQDDGLEENDAFTSPHTISMGDSHDHAFVFTFDHDWYNVWVEAGNLMEFSLTFEQGATGDINVEIYDSHYNLLNGSYSSTNDEIVTVAIGVSDYYLIHVYQLTEDRSGSHNWNLGQSVIDDYLGENDNFSTAMSLNWEYYNFIQGDDDWYRISVQDSYELKVWLFYDDGITWMELELYDDSEMFLDSSQSYISLVNTNGNRDYYFRVYGNNDSAEYNLDLQTNLYNPDDWAEDNDDQYNAYWLNYNSYYSDLNLYDNDWYELGEVFEQETVVVLVEFDTALYEIGIELIDQNGNPHGYSNTDETEGIRLEWTAYSYYSQIYINIFGFMDGAPYNLDIYKFVDDWAEDDWAEDDWAEDNNYQGEAYSISDNEHMSDMIQNNDDYYQFQANIGDQIHVELQVYDGSVLDIEILNSNDEIIGSEYGVNDFNENFTIDMDDSYFIKISGDDSGSQYTLVFKNNYDVNGGSGDDQFGDNPFGDLLNNIPGYTSLVFGSVALASIGYLIILLRKKINT
jgi:hypothetical protein